MHAENTLSPVYGLMVEFETPEELVLATRQVVAAGYKKLDAFSPFPIEEVSDLVSSARQKFHTLPLLVLGAGITGLATAFLLQWYTSAISFQIFNFWRVIIDGYPLNIGGRPFNSWPAFMVVMFELTVLFSAGTAVVGMFGLNGLPLLYHPVFNVERFNLASTERFFLCIEATDPQFNLEQTKKFLEGLKPANPVEKVMSSEHFYEGLEWAEL